MIHRVNLLLLMVALGVAACAARRPPSIEDWDWVHEVEREIWTQLTDSLEVDDRGRTGADMWEVTVRAGDGWGSTWDAVVRREWNGKVCGDHVRMLGDNLRRQLVNLHMASPEITMDEAVERLAVASGEVCSPVCPAMLELGEQLETLETTAMPENVLRLHAPEFRVEIMPANNSSRFYRLSRDEGRLTEWCHDLLSAFEQCIPTTD